MMRPEMHLHCHVQCPVLLPDLAKFHENPFRGSRSMLTNRQKQQRYCEVKGIHL
jgi:hypothetical protein